MPAEASAKEGFTEVIGIAANEKHLGPLHPSDTFVVLLRRIAPPKNSNPSFLQPRTIPADRIHPRDPSVFSASSVSSVFETNRLYLATPISK